tara:strand:- start:509 stop:769 length:261 start_codon:yes stop_codon:yes gene_type:complete
MPKIEIYTTAVCPYCVRAKLLLQSKGLTWEEIRIDLECSRQTEMIERSERRSVPQIFINDLHIGGFDDLAKLDADNRLDQIIENTE